MDSMAQSLEQIISDSENDIQVREDALDCFKRFYRFVPRITAEKFLEKGEEQDPLRFRLGKALSFLPPIGFYMDMGFAYPEGSKYESLIIAFGLNRSGSYNGNSGVFYEQGIGREPTLVFYISDPKLVILDDIEIDQYRIALEENRQPPKPYSELFDARGVLEKLNRDSKIKSTFVHEFIHFNDFLRAKYPKEDTTKRPKYVSHTQNYKQYINNSLEINARYLEWINNILDSFTRLLKVKQLGIKGAFPTFQEFLHFYFLTPGFIPASLSLHINNKNTLRLVKRLYKFYDFVTSDENFTKKQALEFARIESEREILRQLNGD
jgi:hypothetical protein